MIFTVLGSELEYFWVPDLHFWSQECPLCIRNLTNELYSILTVGHAIYQIGGILCGKFYSKVHFTHSSRKKLIHLGYCHLTQEDPSKLNILPDRFHSTLKECGDCEASSWWYLYKKINWYVCLS